MQASSCFSKATARSKMQFFDVPVLSNALPIAGKSKRKQPRRRGRSRRGTRQGRRGKKRGSRRKRRGAGRRLRKK